MATTNPRDAQGQAGGALAKPKVKEGKNTNRVGIEPRRIMFGQRGGAWSRNPGTPMTHQYG